MIFLTFQKVFLPLKMISLPREMIFLPFPKTFLPSKMVFLPRKTIPLPFPNIFLGWLKVFLPREMVFLGRKMADKGLSELENAGKQTFNVCATLSSAVPAIPARERPCGNGPWRFLADFPHPVPPQISSPPRPQPSKRLWAVPR